MLGKLRDLLRPKHAQSDVSAGVAEGLARARRLQEGGLLDEAAAEYRSVLGLHPGQWDCLNALGSIALQTREHASAIQIYGEMIGRRRDHAPAYYKRANAFNALGQWDRALTDYDQAVRLDPQYTHALCNRGAVLERLHRWDDALRSYDAALGLDPHDALTHFNRASVLKQLGEFDAALASYDRAIASRPDYADAYVNRGNLLREMRRFDAAVESYDTALELLAPGPSSRLAHHGRGLALAELTRYEEALSSYDRAMREDCDDPVLHGGRGFVLAALQRFDEALLCFRQAVDLNAEYVEVHYAAGHVLRELGRYEEAIASYDAVIAGDPAGPLAFPAHCSKAFVLKDLKRLAEALASYDGAISLKSDESEAYLNRGCVLQELGCHRDAISSFDRAIALKPDLVGAFQGRGFSLLNQGLHDQAIASFDRAIALEPDQKYLLGFRRYVQMQVCDWGGLAAYANQLDRDLHARKPVSAPFQVLALVDSPLLHRLAAEVWVNEECPPNDSLGPIAEGAVSGKIRVGYFSADFRNHPVALLTAELFETHDRTQFEIIAFAFGPTVQDAVRERLERAFDQFIDVSEKSDRDVAETARHLKLDIAVDLGGFTESARPRVFALRAAPIQMSYIGYLGTMGAPYMDYLLADPTIIPPEEQPHYSEKIVYLPSYQVNDSKRPTVERALTRAELGLPATGFVYSCFNTNYKITPGTFDTWMRILARVEGAHLFLYAGNETAERNLRSEASRRGIDAGRIVFGKYLPQADYLARFRAMDLFLDTLPYNAGTTASDALWAGLPVLTLAGRGFAGRVAASLLTAIDVPELIASTAEDYVETAVHLAATPQRLREIKLRLARNRLTTPLFDTRSFTRHLEAAYVQVHERRRAGQPPEHVHITPRNPLTKFGST